MEEFIYYKAEEEIIYFVENECSLYDIKLKFVELILKYYIDNKNKDVLNLINNLINKKIIQKSLFSKSIKNIYSNNCKTDIKNILIILKIII